MLESVYVAFAPGQLVGTFRKVEDAYEAIIGFLNTIPQESTLDFTFLPLQEVKQQVAQGKHSIMVANLGVHPDYEAYDHVYLELSHIR